jgi:hypothetical protein
MKEYGEGVMSKAEYEYNKWKDHLIDKEGGIYICSVCKKVWNPTIEDINAKRMTTYCKLCRACRLKSFLKGREYKGKKGNNYNKLYDSNSQTGEVPVELEQ